MDRDVYDCIGSAKATPFDLKFDAQAEAAEELYSLQMKFRFSRYDIMQELERLRALYPQEQLTRAKEILHGQMRRYPVCF